MKDIIDFAQAKIDKDQPTLEEVIVGFTSNNCDKNRPHLGQQPLRDEMEIKGLTRRDIQDCMVLGILECRPDEGREELPRIYTSEKGNEFKDWESLLASDEGYKDSRLDAERITWNDLYGWDFDQIDPVAAVQNMACYLERRMGVYPALLDGELTILSVDSKKTEE